MTLAVSPSRPAGGGAVEAAARPLFERFWAAVAFGAMLSLLMSRPRAVEIWRDNTFFDTDDAMRLVQVRAWMAGQGWFDLVAHRLDPPAGLPMHWSRVVDVPVAALIRLFGLFVAADPAERLARIAFPLLLQGALVAATLGVARLAAGRRALLPALLLTVLSGFQFEQFPPGRIDHHAPQIVLLMAMTGGVLAALTRGRAGWAALAGAALSVSLAISLENLPFMAVIVAVPPLAWAWRGWRAAAAMRAFALGLAMSAPLLFVATVPPERYGAVAADAFSVLHLVGVLAGALALIVLAALTPRLLTTRARLAAIGVAALLLAALLAAAFPTALHGPYAGMDPVLQRFWLSTVTEAQPLLTAARLRPDTMTALGCPLFVGAAGLGLAAWKSRGVARLRWLALLALTLAGIAGTFWQIRVAASTQPLALMGGVWAAGRLIRPAGRAGAARASLGAVALTLPFTTLAWAFVPAGAGDEAAAAALRGGQLCRAAPALAPLAALPPGLVFAPVDDGSHLLVATPHAVVAAPYHRNQAGNRRVLDGFRAASGADAAIVRGTGARYVMLCPGEVEIGMLARAAPEGLAARLLRGEVPGWLRPLDLDGTPYRVFAIEPPPRGAPARG